MRVSNPITLVIKRLVGRGVALAHYDGETVLVQGALAGETVHAVITNRRRGIVEAHAIEVLANPHPARLATICPQASHCGGCDWPHVEAKKGARLKAEVAAQAARSHRELSAALAAAPVHASPLNYRLRSRLHWDPEQRILGFYAPKSRQAVVIEGCSLISDKLAKSIVGLTAALVNAQTPYAELDWVEDLDGATAIVALRPSGRNHGSIAARFLPSPDACRNLVDGFHCQDTAGTITTGWGAATVTMALPIPLTVPVGCFFQVNTFLVPWLFERVRQLAANSEPRIIDLHAGVGFLAAAANSNELRETTMVEPFIPAARAAQKNLPDAEVHCGLTAENFLAKNQNLAKDTLVITDPPRAGMTKELRKSLTEWLPNRILMMACDPSTWARDAADLIENGYRLQHLELIDLFPSTHHVEILSVLASR